MYHGDWVSHMGQKHWRSWNCPFCPLIECSSPAILKNHVSIQHPNEIPSSQLDSFISLCGTSNFSLCRGKCPLCYVFDIKTFDQYQSHIEQHLEQLTASVFSDILDETVIGESEASSKHSSISIEHPGPDRSTPSVMLQSNQNDSPTSHNIQRGSFAGTPKGSAVVYLWSCCYCGAGAMNAHTTHACTSCGVARCAYCYVEEHKVGRK